VLAPMFLPRLLRGGRRLVVPALALAALGLGATACTPDTTRARVENDVPETFANSYALSEQLQGKPATRPDVTSTECHSSVNPTQDSGPGSWNCDLTYAVDGRQAKTSLLVLIDQLGCYQALDGEHRDATITDKATGTVLADPKVGFDGCYDVYDGRTSTNRS
jgi:hypothetical protein